jgi:hypothetical protein
MIHSIGVEALTEQAVDYFRLARLSLPGNGGGIGRRFELSIAVKRLELF